MKIPAEMLQVARQLGPLRESVVFLGGMVRGMLVTDPAVSGPRATRDVVVICDASQSSPPVDFMPLDPSVLGFSNVWYPAAYREAQRVDTNAGVILVVTAPPFLATKLEAGNEPFRRSAPCSLSAQNA